MLNPKKVFVFRKGESFLDVLGTDVLHTAEKLIKAGHKGLHYVWSGSQEDYETRISEGLGFIVS